MLLFQNMPTEDIESNSPARNGEVRTPESAMSESTSATTPQPTQTEEERLLEAYKSMPFDEKDNDEWILVALVLDNLLGWIFFGLLIVTTSIVLIMPLVQSVKHV